MKTLRTRGRSDLFCKLQLGHHWLAQTDAAGNFTRRCIYCGKSGTDSKKWNGHLVSTDRATNPDRGQYY